MEEMVDSVSVYFILVFRKIRVGGLNRVGMVSRNAVLYYFDTESNLSHLGINHEAGKVAYYRVRNTIKLYKEQLISYAK